jgi:glycosyltransferase involved in cell wall biosynthesis
LTVYCSHELFNAQAPVELRLGEAAGFQADVVHLNQTDDPDIVDFLRLRAPVVISAHGFLACTSGVNYFRPGHECGRGHGVGCIPNLMFKGCAHTRDPRQLPRSYRKRTRVQAALRSADLVVSYSTAVDAHLAANGVAQRRIVPYFPTHLPCQPSANAGGRRILFAGRIVTPKGVAVLIKAARLVDGEFVICGDGWQLEAMRKLARRLGVQDRVSFRGWLGPDELAQEFADASVIAVPSVWPEPFGLTGIEGFAAGRPAVATATGGIADWLEDGVSGLLVAPGDVRAFANALEQILSDPVRADAMGSAGARALAEKFTVEHHVAAILGAYEAARSTWESARSEAIVLAAAG